MNDIPPYADWRWRVRGRDPVQRAVVRARMAVRCALMGPRLQMHPSAHLDRHVTLATMGEGMLRIGPHTRLAHYCALTGPGHITVGARCWIGVGAQIAAHERITLDDVVIVGPYVVMVDYNHTTDDPAVPAFDQPLHTAPIHIKRGAWIGAHAVILPGVTVGAHAVVAAGAVVRHDVPDGATVGGVPARVIKERATP